MLDNAPGTLVARNNIYPQNTYGLRFTNVASSNVVSEQNYYMTTTSAFELPLMGTAISTFVSRNDSIVASSAGWADIGLITDGSGASAPPTGVSFEHLYVGTLPASGNTTITSASNLVITDSNVAAATTLSGPSAIPYSVGVTTLSLRDNTWVNGLNNGATNSSDLSAGQLNIAGMTYSGSSGTSTGYEYATGATLGSCVGVNWSGVVTAGNYAAASITAPSSGATCSLGIGAFGFAIPLSAQVLGIQVQFQRYLSGGVSSAFSATSGQVCLSSITGGPACKTAISAWTWASATETLGSSSDLWGTTWTPVMINAGNFRISITPSFTLTGTTNKMLELGSYQINVFYNNGGTLSVANLSIPGLTSTIAGPTTPATLGVTVTSGVVTGCSVTTGGVGYPYTPACIISGGGTGASCTLTMVGGVITACAASGGTGYTSGTTTAVPASGAYANLVGGLIFQWSSGATVASSAGSVPQQVIPFPYTFPHGCLSSSVTTQVNVASGSGDAIFQQIGPCTTTGVGVVLQDMSSSWSGSTYTPVVMAIGG